MHKISIIVPCYNEEAVLYEFFRRLQAVEEKLGLEFEYLFINDGSTDHTLAVLREFQAKHSGVHYVSFSRNFGKEAAIYAGLKEASGDYVTFLDADLQDPPELLIDMYRKIQEDEIDCVAARRENRKGESLVISFFSRLFYKMMNKMSKTKLVDGVRDYRLMTRQMAQSILELSEYSRFSKGLFAWVGYNTVYVSYPNSPRLAGKTKWKFGAKVKYAFDGFINFSEVPLEIVTYTGLSTVLMTGLAIIVLIIRQLFFHRSVSGWTSLVVIILFCFGFTLLTLGVIGKYISSIFLESKHRPIYIVKEKR